MDQSSLGSLLADLDLPAIRYFDRLDSTNAEARRWVTDAAPHAALVLADEQTAGRGRLGRRWYTPPGASLAFSLVFRSPPLPPQDISHLVGLGAVAVCQALQDVYHLSPEIKWPNDVLLDGRKVAGVLVESSWTGESLTAAILGVGINIAPHSIEPPTQLAYPATCVESAAGVAVDRLEFLHAVLYQLMALLPRLSEPAFIRQWEALLAFRDQWVEISAAPPLTNPGTTSVRTEKSWSGRLIGLTSDGSLRLLTPDGAEVTLTAGEVHVRPTSQGAIPL